MVDFGDVDMVCAQADELRIADELPGGIHDRFGKGGGEHAGVDGAPGQITLQLLHVRVEAHGEHPVGFVVDQHF